MPNIRSRIAHEARARDQLATHFAMPFALACRKAPKWSDRPESRATHGASAVVPINSGAIAPCQLVGFPRLCGHFR